MSSRGEGESIFEKWAGQHSVRIRRIRETRGKRPDYWVVCPRGGIVVEVKDLAPNAAEQAFERDLDRNGHDFHAWIPGDRIRERLKKANQKYQPWRRRDIPCLTFVFNNTRIPALTSNINVFAAMFGRLSFAVPVSGSSQEMSVVAKDKRVMTPECNTSTSAVVVNEWDYGTGYTMIVYHNLYAVNPLAPLDVASVPGVRQFRVRREDDGEGGFWVEI